MVHKNTVTLCLVGVLLISSFSFLSAAKGGVVTRKVRQEALSKGTDLLNSANEELKAGFAEVLYPFSFEEEEEVVTPDKPKAAPKAPEIKPVTDEMVLQAVAKSIQPKGVMARAGKYRLVLGNGHLSEGYQFKTRVRGEVRLVILNKITPDYFTLTLNGKELTRKIGDRASSEKISMDKDEPSEPEPDSSGE